jgi:hypothetical protein
VKVLARLESARKEEGKMQYLITMNFVDPGPLLPPQQFLGMLRQAVLLDMRPSTV